MAPTSPGSTAISRAALQTGPAGYFEVRADVGGILQSNGFYPQGGDSLRLSTGGLSSGSSNGEFGYFTGQYAISGSAGSQSANLDLSTAIVVNDALLRSPYGEIRYTSANGTIKVYVLGPPGTAYRLQRSGSCHTHVSLGTGGGNFSASAPPCTSGPSSDDQSFAVTDSGVSSEPTVSYANQIYSYVGTYSVSSRSDLSTSSSTERVTGEAHARGILTIVVQGTQPQQPPVARISGPSAVTVNSPAMFDGSASSDPDGTISQYEWTFETPTALVTRSGVRPSFAWDTPGTYQVTLTVTDNDNLTSTTDTSITVEDNVCRVPGNPGRVMSALAQNEPSNRRCRPEEPEESTITFSAFIPGNNMSAAPLQCLSVTPLTGLYVKTDDRWFDPNGFTFRVRQTVTVTADATRDPNPVRPGSARTLSHDTRLFGEGALPVIDQGDEDGVPLDCHGFHRKLEPHLSGTRIWAGWSGPNTVRVQLAGNAGTRLGFPLSLEYDISWFLDIVIDATGTRPTATLLGSSRHDGFPAYEIYVNGKSLYEHSPGQPPYGLSDLLKLGGEMEVVIAPRTITL